MKVETLLCNEKVCQLCFEKTDQNLIKCEKCDAEVHINCIVSNSLESTCLQCKNNNNNNNCKC